MWINSCTVHIILALIFSAWVSSLPLIGFWTGLLWIVIGGIALGLIFPAMKAEETVEQARAGFMQRLIHDPFLYAGLAAIGFFLIEALNGGRHLVYEPKAGEWAFTLPVWRWGPSSVMSADAWRTCTLAFACIGICAVLRHATGKAGRMLVLQCMSWHAAAIALWMVVRIALQQFLGLYGLPSLIFSAPSDAVGAYYVLMLAISCGLALDRGILGQFSPWMALPLILNFSGVLLSSHPPSILVAWAFAVTYILYVILFAWPLLSIAQITKNMVLGIVPFLIGGALYVRYHSVNLFISAAYSSGSWGDLIAGWMPGYPNSVEAAFCIWGQHPWMGVGSGGFKSFAPMHGLVEFMRADRHAGHDLAEYLCEHGLIGCGLVAIAVGTIMFGYARRIALLPQVSNGFGTLPDRCLLFRMTPMAVVLSFGAVLVCGLSFIGSVFHSPFVALSWCATVTCLGSFLPMRRAI
jgi:hypothetical protein